MKTIGVAFIAALALGAASTCAIAADLIVSPDPIVDAGGFSWEGPYVGGFLSTYLGAGQLGIGGEFGYNFLPSESILLGLSVSGAYYFTGYAPEAFVKGRIGFVADNFAVYGFGDVGNYMGGPGLWGVGVGVELALTDSLSIDVEGSSIQQFGVAGNNPRVEAGLRMHF